MRMFSLVLFFMVALWAENPMVLQLTGVKTTHMMDNGKAQEVLIERNTPKECNGVGINPEAIFSGDYAGKNVPSLCQKSFVTTVGKAQPMSFAQGVVTVGEVEVLDFIKNKLNVNPSAYVLVDARKRDWYEQMTIPSSINIPFDEIEYDEAIPEDFERVQALLGFRKVGEAYDFSRAKTALLFCNGIWCVQSRLAIEKLIKMGYPREKLLWYRGGLQDWLALGFTTVVPK